MGYESKLHERYKKMNKQGSFLWLITQTEHFKGTDWFFLTIFHVNDIQWSFGLLCETQSVRVTARQPKAAQWLAIHFLG